MSNEKFSDLTGNETRDLPACSTVPQPATLPFAPITNSSGFSVTQYYGTERFQDRNSQNVLQRDTNITHPKETLIGYKIFD
jgi:hypothetical protein